MPKSAKQQFSGKDEQKLMEALWDPEISDDPYQFVMFVYPWGEEGTPLEYHDGPRTWQAEVLQEIAHHIDLQKRNIEHKQPLEVFQEAISSGRGPGKSTLFSWLTHWMMSTRLGATCIVTANTEAQLKGVTWGEMGKWFNMALNSHWFDLSALAIRPAEWFGELISKQLKISTTYYYAEARLWSEENPDAFAGVHNPNGVMLLMDEASGIAENIWTVSEGYFTEPIIHRYWLAASNPRKNTGAFFECFHRNRKYWRTRCIDSRTVEGTDPAVYEKIIDKYGADSDEARVEVYGEFPRQGDQQFIARDLAQGAQQREIGKDPGAALVMGVDVARFGDDQSVIRMRKGRDARTYEPIKFKGLDTHQLAQRCAQLFNEYGDCRRIFVDGAGVGGGVVDNLHSWGYPVVDVQSAAKANDELRYANKRAEMWGEMKEWLQVGGIDPDPELYDDLVGPDYHYDAQSRVMLERKDQMKKRGLASPDNADALALTFAEPVARDDMNSRLNRRRNNQARDVDYDFFG